MFVKRRSGYTMLELVFVIAIVGILSAIAIPKFAVSRSDAIIVKAKTTVSSIRSAISSERQKRIMRGDFNAIYKLSSSSDLGDPIFDAFDGDTNNPVLEYPPLSCETATTKGCWRETKTGSKSGDESEYTFNMPTSGSVVFTLKNNRFDCDISDSNCKLLTQ